MKILSELTRDRCAPMKDLVVPAQSAVVERFHKPEYKNKACESSQYLGIISISVFSSNKY